MVRTHPVRRLIDGTAKDGTGATIASAAGRILKTKTRVRVEQWWRYGRRHAAELDPYRIQWIDPSMVYQRNPIPIGKSEYHLAHVVGGEWDLDRRRFEHRMFFRSFEQHFRNGVPWHQTHLYRSVLRGEKNWRGIGSQRELDERCAYVDELYHSIRRDGYKTQRELRSIPPRTPREVKIQIGRDGEYFYLNGKHRLTIAKLLDLDRIPVNVIVRHAKWQALRDDIIRRDAGLTPDDRDDTLEAHPDLAYLLT